VASGSAAANDPRNVLRVEEVNVKGSV
jgi:hypothetical protein